MPLINRLDLLGSRLPGSLGTDSVRRALAYAVMIVAVYWVCAAVYRWSPGHHQMADSTYELVVSENLWRTGSCRLDTALTADRLTPLPYQLVRLCDGSVYYGYPLGSSILSLPFTAYHAGKGRGCFDPQTGLYDFEREMLLQRRLAGGIAAATAVVFLLIARCWLTWGWASAVTLLFAFGSMLWSSMSRSLWSHDWSVLLLGLAVLGLAWFETLPGMLNRWWVGLGVGSALPWMLLCRPQTAISVAAIGVFLAVRHRRLLVPVVLSGLIWLGGFVTVSEVTFHQITSPTVYSPDQFTSAGVGGRLVDVLLCPSRGLLIFCPYLVLIAIGLICCRRTLPTRQGLLIPAVLALTAQVAMLACYLGWHGGASYGPRYFADILPWLVILAAVSLRATRDRLAEGMSRWRYGITGAVVAIVCVWSIFIHAWGAIEPRAWLWLYRYKNGGEAVVTDWHYPQFLAGLTHEVQPDGSIEPLSFWK